MNELNHGYITTYHIKSVYDERCTLCTRMCGVGGTKKVANEQGSAGPARLEHQEEKEEYHTYVISNAPKDVYQVVE